MLKNIPVLIGPELFSALWRMGHGDEVVIADANFPGERLNARTIRLDAVQIVDLLDAILPFITLDTAVGNALLMMQSHDWQHLIQDNERIYTNVLINNGMGDAKFSFLAKPDFYERARNAYAVVMTGSSVRFGNIIIRKGVI